MEAHLFSASERPQRSPEPLPGDTDFPLRLLGKLPDQIYEFLEAHGTSTLVALLLAFVVGALCTGSARALWFDEMFTLDLAIQPNLHLLHAGMPVDGNPPLLPLLSYAMVRLFGAGAFAVRLPSLIGYTGAVALVFSMARRRLGVVCGLIAGLALCAVGPVVYYATEARPYGLVLGFTALAFFGWEVATDPQRPRRGLLWLVPAGIAGAVLSHHVALFGVGVPLLLAEAVRTVRRRRFDWPVWLAPLPGLLPLVWTVPMIRVSHQMLATYTRFPVQRVRIGELGSDYRQLTDPALLVFAVLAAVLGLRWLVLRLRRREQGALASTAQRARLPWTAAQAVLALSSALVLAMLFELVAHTTRYWVGIRYGLTSAIGLALIASAICAFAPRSIRLLMVLVLAMECVHIVHLPKRHAVVPGMSCLEALPADTPVVIGPAFDYSPLWWYSSPTLRGHLFFLADPDFAARQSLNVHESGLWHQRALMPWPLTPYGQFLRSHRSFVLVTDQYPEFNYLPRHLEESGYRVEPYPVGACAAGPLTAHRVSAP